VPLILKKKTENFNFGNGREFSWAAQNLKKTGRAVEFYGSAQEAFPGGAEGKKIKEKKGRGGPWRARLLHGQRGHAAHAHASGGTDAGRHSPPLQACATDGKRKGGRLGELTGGRRWAAAELRQAVVA
jgi:hypothetical protein